MRWNKWIIVALLIVLIIIAVETRYDIVETRHGVSVRDNHSARQAIINNHPISLEIADTPEKRYQGLSDRENLCQSCGMLFLFDDSVPRTFVMRRMHFPLDIVWINDGKIIRIDTNLPPESAEPYTEYSSGQGADTVLELNAGGAKTYELTIGQAVSL